MNEHVAKQDLKFWQECRAFDDRLRIKLFIQIGETVSWAADWCRPSHQTQFFRVMSKINGKQRTNVYQKMTHLLTLNNEIKMGVGLTSRFPETRVPHRFLLDLKA